MSNPALPPYMVQAHHAFQADDATQLRRLLETHADLRSLIDLPNQAFGTRPIHNVKSTAMLDVLLDFGADVNGGSRWDKGSFGMLETVPEPIACYALTRGATLTVHGAARLGRVQELREMLERDPALVRKPGGDGKLALHYAATPEIAELLLAHGADIDARDEDHRSTAAQYLVKPKPDVVRYLVSRGCATDILMAAALGDEALAQRILADDPDAIRMRVSEEWFPVVGDGSGTGGTIYQWELGWHVSAVQVAEKFGHHEMAAKLDAAAPLEEQLLNACWLHHEGRVRALLATDSGLASRLPATGRRQLAHAARNNDTEAVRLMLEARLPTDARSQHNATALHWAAFHGNAAMVRLLLAQGGIDVEDKENEYNSTPLGWAIHGSTQGWYVRQGDYATAVDLLLQAGARKPPSVNGSDAVRAVLSRHGVV